MPTRLNKKLTRETSTSVHEAGADRPIIIELEPPNLLGFRLKRTKKTYYLTAEACYSLAVKAESYSSSKQTAGK